MKLRQGSRIGPVGVDLGDERLHLVQLQDTTEGVRIRAAASVVYGESRESILSSPRRLKGLIAEALKSRPFVGRRVVAAMPADQIKLMVLNYELSDPAQEPAVILDLIRERIQQPLEASVIDYLPLRRDNEKPSERSALVAIAPKDRVIDTLELLRSSGLRVEALEIGPGAVRRLVRERARKSHHEHVLAIHFGRHRSYLIILWGRRLLLYRGIDFGVDPVQERVAKALDMTPDAAASLLRDYGAVPDPVRPGMEEISGTLAEIIRPCFDALAEQVASALVYAASRTRGQSVDHVYLLGAVARFPGADGLLGSILSIPTLVLDPAVGIPYARDDSVGTDLDSAATLALAAGLALRGMTNDE